MQDRFSSIIAKRALLGPYAFSEITKSLIVNYGRVSWSNGDMLHTVSVQRYTRKYGYWKEIHYSAYHNIHNADNVALKLCKKYVEDKDARVIMNCVIVQDSKNGLR